MAAAQTHQHGPPEAKGIDLAKLPPPQRDRRHRRGPHSDHDEIARSPTVVRPGTRAAALLLGLRSRTRFRGSRPARSGLRHVPLGAVSSRRFQRRSRSGQGGAGPRQGTCGHRHLTASSATFAPPPNSRTRRERKPPRSSSRKWKRSQIAILTICRPNCFSRRELDQRLRQQGRSAPRCALRPGATAQSAARLSRQRCGQSLLDSCGGRQRSSRLGTRERRETWQAGARLRVTWSTCPATSSIEWEITSGRGEIFLEAARVDHDYMDKQHVSLRDDWNYAHNLSYSDRRLR